MSKSIKTSKGEYLKSSHHIAHQDGQVHIYAQYFVTDNDGHVIDSQNSFEDGYSNFEPINNNSFKRMFRNAVKNGAMKFLWKTNHKKDGYTNYSWTYHLKKWEIIYKTQQPLRIYFNKSNQLTKSVTDKKSDVVKEKISLKENREYIIETDLITLPKNNANDSFIKKRFKRTPEKKRDITAYKKKREEKPNTKLLL